MSVNECSIVGEKTKDESQGLCSGVKALVRKEGGEFWTIVICVALPELGMLYVCATSKK